MPVTQLDFDKRLDVRYVPLLKRLPEDFSKYFSNKDIRYALENFKKGNFRQGMTVFNGSIFDPEANLFLGSLYLAGLKQDVSNENIRSEKVLAKIIGFSPEEVGIVNKHRFRIGAPVIHPVCAPAI